MNINSKCKFRMLEKWRAEKTYIYLYGTKGVLLKGFVEDFCEDTVLLDTVLVFQTNIISMKPGPK